MIISAEFWKTTTIATATLEVYTMVGAVRVALEFVRRQMFTRWQVPP
jgi:hypothetical protein